MGYRFPGDRQPSREPIGGRTLTNRAPYQSPRFSAWSAAAAAAAAAAPAQPPRPGARRVAPGPISSNDMNYSHVYRHRQSGVGSVRLREVFEYAAPWHRSVRPLLGKELTKFDQ